MCVHIYIYIYIYIHTHTHTHNFVRWLWLLRLKTQVHSSIYEEEKSSFIPSVSISVLGEKTEC